MTPADSAALDPAAQQQRVDRLKVLYMRDRRYREDHPLHSLYTGLHLQAEQPTPETDS